MKKTLIVSITITCCLFLFHVSFAQDYLTNLSTFNVEDGLSGRNVLHFFEDSKNIVWIATTKGLDYFDGKNFVNFLEKEKWQVPYDCGEFAEDIDGNIWTCYIKENPNIKYEYIIDKYFQKQAIDDYFEGIIPFKAEMIDFIKQIEGNILYVVTNKGEIYKYDGKFSLISAHEAYIGAHVVMLNEFGELVVKTHEAIIFIKLSDGQKRSTTIEKGKPSTYFSYEYKPWAMPYFKEGIYENVLFREVTNVKVFTQEISPLTSPDITIHRRKLGDKVRYIIRGKDVLAIIDEDLNLKYDFSKKLHRNDKIIYPGNQLLVRENQIWFNTTDGFAILEYRRNPFQNYFNKQAIFSTRGITELANGHLLMVSYSGVKDINPQSQEVQTLDLSNFSVHEVIEKTNKELIFGTYNKQLLSYQPQSQSVELISLVKAEQEATNANFLIPFEDNQHRIWVGATQGLIEYDIAIDSLRLFDRYNGFEELRHKSIHYFFEDEEGIWLATSDGLFLLNPNSGIAACYQPLDQLNIQHFYRERDTFWLATTSHGLVKWNKKDNSTHIYNRKNGMLDDYLMAVYPDTLDNLWLSSEMGLVRFHKPTEQVQVFLTSDGITHNEFNTASHFQDKNGHLYFGGLKGVTTFDPNNFEARKTKNASFRVTNYYELNDKKGIFEDKTSNLLKKEKITLSPGIKAFRIHFALLNYKNVAQTRYIYKIEGLENNWTQQNEAFIRINLLPYGNYTLKIKAQDYSGREMPQQLIIPIEVVRPFYARKIWQLVGLFFLCLLIYGLIKWRIFYIEKEKEKLEQIVQQRTEIIATQKEELSQLNHTKDQLFAILAHDLRNPLTSFKSLSKSINYLIDNRDLKRIKALGKYIEKESTQLYHLLDNLLNWALAQRQKLVITCTQLNLSKIVDDTIEQHSPLAKMLEIELKNEVNPKLIVVADARILETVLRNLISNALRYAPKKLGYIAISAQATNHQVRIEIKDNGTGIQAEVLAHLFQLNKKNNTSSGRRNISFGLHLCKEMIELIDGTIEAESEVGKGTVFIISLPSGTHV